MELPIKVKSEEERSCTYFVGTVHVAQKGCWLSVWTTDTSNAVPVVYTNIRVKMLILWANSTIVVPFLCRLMLCLHTIRVHLVMTHCILNISPHKLNSWDDEPHLNTWTTFFNIKFGSSSYSSEQFCCMSSHLKQNISQNSQCGNRNSRLAEQISINTCTWQWVIPPGWCKLCDRCPLLR